MKLLTIAEFDPAGVCLSHRDCLRALDVDARVALHVAYTERQRDADYSYVWFDGLDSARKPLWKQPGFNREELETFAREADVIQVCPGIGQPWADSPMVCPGTNGEDPPSKWLLGVDWRAILREKKKKVAYFHGSVNAWARRREYAEHFLNLGYDLATSTLDYACELPAAYLPPWMPDLGPLAHLRGDDEPLTVVHTPTNPPICGTQAFLDGCRKLGVIARFRMGLSHRETLDWKRTCVAGFDHFRGSFSVNSLENCKLGLANLVGLKDEYRTRLLLDGFSDMPGERVLDAPTLWKALARLDNDPDLTRQQQKACRQWVNQNFGLEAIAERLSNYYRGL